MHGRPYKLLLLGLSALLLAGSGFMQRALNRERSALGLTRMEPLENAPPILAFTTVALGGFRGLIANALWIRANELQLEDKFFEQVQLSSWISKLEPHFTQVWLVQSWNMAYNISVKFRAPEDRWRWVQRGIELLRDEGLKYNPKEALLYRELAWFYQHKMGQNLDDAHLYYKYTWARIMTNALGGIRPDYEALLNPQTDAHRAHLAILRDELKMDPVMMKKTDDFYGPLEWRLPEATAMYWATVGLEKANNKDLTTLRRVIYQCSQVSVLRGRIILVRGDGSFSTAPDFAKIPQAIEGFEKMRVEEKEKPYVVERPYRNFLKEVVYLLYMGNRVAEANRWMAVLKEKFPDAIPKQVTAEEFALNRMTESVGDVDNARTTALITSLILQHLDNLAIGEDDRATGILRMSRQIYDYYVGKTSSRQVALKLPPFNNYYQEGLSNKLQSLPPEFAARLRTSLNLPAPTAPATNAPPARP